MALINKLVAVRIERLSLWFSYSYSRIIHANDCDVFLCVFEPAHSMLIALISKLKISRFSDVTLLLLGAEESTELAF
jgi:hypothetical protein